MEPPVWGVGMHAENTGCGTQASRNVGVQMSAASLGAEWSEKSFWQRQWDAGLNGTGGL